MDFLFDGPLRLCPTSLQTKFYMVLLDLAGGVMVPRLFTVLLGCVRYGGKHEVVWETEGTRESSPYGTVGHQRFKRDGKD